MLKELVGGSQTLVFMPYQEAGVTKRRPHQFKKPRVCRQIIGCVANALYLSAMLREVPCGKEQVVHCQNPEGEAAKIITEHIRIGTWFRFAEVDIEIPEPLWQNFEEMLLFFFTKQIPDEAVPQHMKDYLVYTGRKRGDGKKLVGALSAQKLLLYAPLWHWYVEHGAVIKAVHICQVNPSHMRGSLKREHGKG